MKRMLLAALALTGCRDLTDPDVNSQQGKAQHAAFRLAPLKGMVAETATTTLGDFLYTDCDGLELTVAGGAVVDLRAGTLVSMEAGEWCGLQFSFQTAVRGNGLTTGGLPWDMELDVLYSAVGNGVKFKILEDRFYVFELADPDWFRAYDLQPDDTGVAAVTVDASHPSHADLAGRIALRSGLLEDADGSTGIDSTERANSLVARGADRF